MAQLCCLSEWGGCCLQWWRGSLCVPENSALWIRSSRRAWSQPCPQGITFHPSLLNKCFQTGVARWPGGPASPSEECPLTSLDVQSPQAGTVIPLLVVLSRLSASLLSGLPEMPSPARPGECRPSAPRCSLPSSHPTPAYCSALVFPCGQQHPENRTGLYFPRSEYGI